jgi:hypothetical protein
MSIQKIKIKLLIIYLYAFFVIYMPELQGFTQIRSHIWVTILLFFMITPYLLKRKIVLNKHIFFLCFGIIVSSIFFAVRAAISGNEIRLIQNNFVIIQIIHICIIISILKKNGYLKDDLIKFLLNIGMFQGIICIAMILIPSFRELALFLYYNGADENIFISANRIYGISGDYTFFTPIFHGTLAIVALIYSILKSYKYLVYIPFLLIAILLNGRTGLLIFVLGSLVALLLLFLRGKSWVKLINYCILTILIIITGLYSIKHLAPNTFNWIMSGFDDTINLFLNDQLEGNYEALLSTMLYWPEGLSTLWGEGHRVFGNIGISFGFVPSDIGYVNDMFMGGIIYIGLLYLPIFRFLFLKNNKLNNLDYLINNILSVALLFVLLLSNYKGESMRGGLVLIGVIYIKLILLDENNHSYIDNSANSASGKTVNFR